MVQKYSDIQKQAVMHGMGPLLVSAGPGSGKTTVLTGRIVYLIQEQKIAPDKIVVITYTREAAGAMEKRFYQMIPQHEARVSFSTFHSLFYRILKSHRAYQHHQIIQDQSQHKLIHYMLENSLFPEYAHWNSNAVTTLVEQTKTAISFYKNTLDYGSYKALLPTEFAGKGREIVEEYRRTLEKRSMLDMDDLLYLTYEVLRQEKEFLHTWQEKFAHYLVDEFQDCNPIQYEILKLLAKHSESIFVVGDEDQAIYGFRGAKPGIMEAFYRDFQRCKRINMGENYRSVPMIVKNADLVIRESKNRQEKELISKVTVSEEGSLEEKMTCRVFLDRQMEWKGIYQELSQMSEEHRNNTCILFRTNLLLQAFVAGLRREHIPFYTKEKGRSIYEHSVYLDIMAYLQVAHGKKDRSLFLRVFRAPWMGVGREALSEEQVSLQQVKSFYQKGAYRNEETVCNIEKLEQNLRRVRGFSLPLAVNYIRKALRYEEYLKNKWREQPQQWNECMTVLELLQEEAGLYQDVEQWMRAQREYQIQFEQMKQKKEETENGVKVMTLHGSKGLEFKQVYIPEVNEGMIPKTDKNKEIQISQEQIDEERRLFYVGMTRAKERLVLSYVKGTQQKPSLPSRFLSPLVHAKAITIVDYSSSSLANSSNS